MQFSEKDLKQIEKLGISQEQVNDQLNRFQSGFPDIELSRTVDEDQGIRKLSSTELKKYIDIFDWMKAGKILLKFVPASGAASRMFKMLFNFLAGEISVDNPDILKFYSALENFAFSNDLKQLFESDEEFEKLAAQADKNIVKKLLLESGLNYGNLPKALLPFHAYPGGHIRKAIDEHLVEGAQYCVNSGNKVELHLTVSPEHTELAKNHLAAVLPNMEKQYGKTFEISFSIQDTATNTIAVDLYNKPLRNESGGLVFRPGGHGALLNNLGKIDADVIFIKNIDNVAAEWLIGDTINYKKALGGIMLETQEKIFEFVGILNKANHLSADREAEIVAFLSSKAGLKVPEEFQSWGEGKKRNYLLEKLNRPLRVCGVVRSSNTGGGPFWVREKDGSESLQLVETAQINKNDPSQQQILSGSKFANITDLVCGIKSRDEHRFDLQKHVDPDTGYVSQKSMNGQNLKAMELPGLWNGAMSDWNTMFVEVPLTTFNPVKTVFDLLKPEHQGIRKD